MKQKEIKFRVWTGSEMITPPQETIGFGSNTDALYLSLGGSLSKRNIFGFNNYSGKETSDKMEDDILMQFTMLNDQNGKEIYEGDIVQYDSECGKVIAKVIFKINNNESLLISGFEFEVIKIEEYEHDNPIDFLVIGNIYENPELVTNK